MAAPRKRKPTPRSNTSGLHRAQRTISADVAAEEANRAQTSRAERARIGSLAGHTTEMDAEELRRGAHARSARRIDTEHPSRPRATARSARDASSELAERPTEQPSAREKPARPITRPARRRKDGANTEARAVSPSPASSNSGPGKSTVIAIVAACCLAALAIGLVAAFALGAFNPPVTSPSEGLDGLYVPPLTDDPATEDDESAQGVTPTKGEASVSLSAVGDNLMHVPVINTADAAEGQMDDGLYDFTVLYQGIRDIVETHDINFIDIETPMGGDDRGISGYPSFNTPSDDAADIAAFGFNLATTATNHAWDGGLEGIRNMSATWAEHPEVVVTGTFTSQEDRDRIRVFEKNGITFAFLAYQDYLNGYVLPDDVKWAIADSNDRTKVKEDIDKAHELAECVIVAMSWGDEYANEPNQSQRDCAQFMADNGVDLILGFGAHVIEPVEWIDASPTVSSGTSEGGNDGSSENPYAGHRTLTVFSLGNFVSNQQDPFNNVEGCFTCDIERDAEGTISIADPTWIPLVNHFSGGTGHTVYQLKNYTEELARQHDVLGWMDDPLGYVRSYTTDIIDPEVVDIDM